MSSSDAPRPERSILERNLELLLTRAYVPVTPSIAFRERLARAIDQALAARARPQSRASSRPPAIQADGKRTWVLRAAAALLCVALGTLAWKLMSSSQPREDRSAAFERIAALGQTAVCTDSGTEVRVVADEEAARGLDYAGPSLTAWVGRDADLSIWLGAAGRCTAYAATRIDARGTPRDDLSFDLERGSIELERYATGGAWRIDTREGILGLDRGTLLVTVAPRETRRASEAPSDVTSPSSVARDATRSASAANEATRSPSASGVTALLRSGSAYLESDGRRIPLALDTEIEIRAGRLFPVEGSLDGESGASARAPLVDSNSVRSAEPAPAPKPTAVLHGVLTCPPDSVLPERYSITLLRDERLPAVAQAEVHAIEGGRREFTLTGLRPGTYTVFAEVHGFAVWQRRGIEIRANGSESAATNAQANPPTDASANPRATSPAHPPANPSAHSIASEIAIDLQRGQRVSGRVIDADSGRPIEGAVVISQRDAPTQLLPLAMERAPDGWISATTTGPDGSFELAALSLGSHRLRATHAGFGAAWTEAIDVRRDAVRDDVELRLQRGGAVFGHVAHKNGTPWSGAMIIASRIDYDYEQHCMSYGTAVADAEGAYAIEDLPAGPYAVLNVLEPSVEHVISPHVTQVNVTVGGRFEVDFATGRKGTRLSGRIRAAAGTALAGLDVIVEPHGPRPHERKWQSERAREDGTFRFIDLSPGEYDVYVSEEMGKCFSLEDTVDVPAVPEFACEVLLGTGEIRGRVVEAANQVGLANCVLVLEVDSNGAQVFAGRSVSDAEGRYALRRLPPGTYRVTAFATAGRFGPESVENLRVDAREPVLASDIRLAVGAALEVKVVEPDGRPIQAAGVTLTDENGRALQFSAEDVTDAHGKLSINGIKPGRWKISVAHTGTRTATTTVDLEADSERAVEIILIPTEPR